VGLRTCALERDMTVRNSGARGEPIYCDRCQGNLLHTYKGLVTFVTRLWRELRSGVAKQHVLVKQTAYQEQPLQDMLATP
jgi:hypothetical protein